MVYRDVARALIGGGGGVGCGCEYSYFRVMPDNSSGGSDGLACRSNTK